MCHERIIWKMSLFVVLISCLTSEFVTTASQASTITTVSTRLPHNLPSDFTFVRGGGGKYSPDEDYDDMYDEDYDEEEYDELEEEEEEYPRRRPPPSSHRNRPPPRGRYPPGRRQPPKSKSSITGNMVNSVSSLAKSSLDVTTTATVASIKGTGKAAYYLASPKHVSRQDIVGVWRLDQTALSASCAANVELTMRGDVLVTYQAEEFRTPYYFSERSWPRSCTIQFEARAFQGPRDEQPVNMLYVASFRRKIADRNVIKMVGKIYQITHSKGKFPFRGSKSQKTLVGTFTARKRFTPPSSQRGHNTKRGRGQNPQSTARRGPKPKQDKYEVENDESEYDDMIYDDDYDEYEYD